MHYYQFNIGDYASHTIGLALLEDLAYRRLIDFYYLSEHPLNGCSSDVARMIGMRENTQEVEYVLQCYFTKNGNEWVHDRIDSDIADYHKKQENRSIAGKKSGEKRQKQTDANHVLNTCSTSVELTNNHKPITNNHKPITINQLDQPAADHELLFNQFWFAGMSKTNKKKAAALFGRVLSKQSNPGEFTAMLCSDIKNRLAANQLGFAEMHPTTYLNGERWNDQQPAHRPAEKSSLIGMLTDRSWADGFIDLNHEGIEHEH